MTLKQLMVALASFILLSVTGFNEICTELENLTKYDDENASPHAMELWCPVKEAHKPLHF